MMIGYKNYKYKTDTIMLNHCNFTKQKLTINGNSSLISVVPVLIIKTFTVSEIADLETSSVAMVSAWMMWQ